MHRRKFVSLTGMGITAGALAESLVASKIAAANQRDTKSSPRKAAMKVGHQHYSSNEILTLLAAFGVNNISFTFGYIKALIAAVGAES